MYVVVSNDPESGKMNYLAVDLASGGYYYWSTLINQARIFTEPEESDIFKGQTNLLGNRNVFFAELKVNVLLDKAISMSNDYARRQNILKSKQLRAKIDELTKELEALG